MARRIPISELPGLVKGKKRGARIKVSPPAERTRVSPTHGTIVFASKAEARYFDELVIEQRAGRLQPPYFLMQVPMRLPGGVVYRVDFVVFWRETQPEFVDVKGHRTEVYKIKKRQVEALYGITIHEAAA